MPMISGSGPSGRDTRRTRRRTVLRLPAKPWRHKCRAPAAPPSASPVSACVVANLIVVRAYSDATLGMRSAKVLRRHVQIPQRKRRTIKRNSMGAVAQGAPIVSMDAMDRLAAIGTGGVGGDHGRHQDETGLINDQGLKLDTVIRWQQIRTEIV